MADTPRILNSESMPDYRAMRNAAVRRRLFFRSDAASLEGATREDGAYGEDGAGEAASLSFDSPAFRFDLAWLRTLNSPPTS